MSDKTLGAYTRHESPDAPECDRHIAHIAIQDRVLRHRNRAIRDLTQERDEARATKDMHKRRADEERARAEKAEKERDHWKREADGANEDLAHLRAAVSRPLTPDAITELVKTSEARLADAIRALYPDVAMSTYRIASAVFDALTPPARPEGAEEIERLIETSPWHLAGSCSAEADWLAEHGVRVVGEGGAA